MLNIRNTLFILIFSVSQLAYSDWVSTIDKEYRSRQPDLYDKVQNSKDIIDNNQASRKMNIQAVNILLLVIEEDDKFAPAYVQIARAISNIGYKINNEFSSVSLKSQEEYLKIALDIEPDYDYALALMGYTQMFKNNLNSAADYYDHASKVDSGYPYLRSQLAQLQTRFGNYEAAIKIATVAYEENKDNPKIASSMINEIIFALKKMPGKLAELDYWHNKRIEIYPEKAWNWGDYANLKLYGFGDHESAIKYSEKALSIMNYEHARFLLAASHYKKWSDYKDNPEKSDEAMKSFRIASQIYPDRQKVIIRISNNSNLANTVKALKLLNE